MRPGDRNLEGRKSEKMENILGFALAAGWALVLIWSLARIAVDAWRGRKTEDWRKNRYF
jgi:hypothetical protein